MIAQKITQGDSLTWTEAEGDYLASNSWVIGYNLVAENKRINFESSASGDDHQFTITTATTDTWTPGQYKYQRYASDGTDRVTLNYGTVEILRNFLTAGDERSHAQKTLDAILAVLESRATQDQMAYTINGRSLTRMNISDLLRFRDVYRAEVAREKNAERIAQGLAPKNKIRVRF